MRINNKVPDNVKEAILQRREALPINYILVSKLLEIYGMTEYVKAAEGRILQECRNDENFFMEHATINRQGKLMLDAEALERYGETISGYVGTEEYQSGLKYIKCLDDLRSTYNFMIQYQRGLSMRMIISSLNNIKKIKGTVPKELEQAGMFLRYELISRTPIARIYSHISKAIERVRIKLDIHRLFCT